MTDEMMEYSRHVAWTVSGACVFVIMATILDIRDRWTVAAFLVVGFGIGLYRSMH